MWQGHFFSIFFFFVTPCVFADTTFKIRWQVLENHHFIANIHSLDGAKYPVDWSIMHKTDKQLAIVDNFQNTPIFSGIFQKILNKKNKSEKNGYKGSYSKVDIQNVLDSTKKLFWEVIQPESKTYPVHIFSCHDVVLEFDHEDQIDNVDATEYSTVIKKIWQKKPAIKVSSTFSVDYNMGLSQNYLNA